MARRKNPAAVALGRLGGKVGGKIGGKIRMRDMTPEEFAAFTRAGGKARAAKLSAKRRSEIAKKAAAARWGKQKRTS
jgi:hypothetical protein